MKNLLQALVHLHPVITIQTTVDKENLDVDNKVKSPDQLSWSTNMDRTLLEFVRNQSSNFENAATHMKQQYPDSDKYFDAELCRSRWCLLDSMHPSEDVRSSNDKQLKPLEMFL